MEKLFYLAISCWLLAISSLHAQAPYRNDSLPRDSDYLVLHQGWFGVTHNISNKILRMDSLHAWGVRQGWGTGGTVTSITAGYGLTGGTITSSGTLKVDSLKVATVYANSRKQDQLNGTGFVKTAGISVSYDNSTYITGNQTITFNPSGDVTGSTTGTTSLMPALSIGAGKITNAMLVGSIAASKLTGTDINTLGTVTTGTWNADAVNPTYGGTGQNTSASTGVAQVNSGTWSVSTGLVNGTTATTQTASDNSTKIATTAFVQNSFAWAFGSGSDGDVTITTNNLTSGPLTSGVLTRDAYFNNLTISGSGTIITGGYKIFIAGVLDLTGASTNAINYNGTNGNNASGGSAGIAGAALTGVTLGGSTQGGPGTNGNTGTASNGVNGNTSTVMEGAAGGIGGAGGNGSSGSGGSASVGASPSGGMSYLRYSTEPLRAISATAYQGGVGGSSGAGGGGNTTNQGGGGGGGGAGGGIIFITVRSIKTSGAASGAISAKGGNGGNGANGTASNTGGGGAGSGGGGGWIYIQYLSKDDAPATNVLDVSGGQSGSGGNSGGGSGTGADGGGGGAGGRIGLFNVNVPSNSSETFGGTRVTGNSHSGSTGGTSVAGQVTKVSF